MPHGRHIDAIVYDMAEATMCEYLQSDHALPHCKFVLRCCAKCPIINNPDQETDYKHPNPSPSTRFYIYYLIARCKKHGRKVVSSVNRILLQDNQQKYTLEKS